MDAEEYQQLLESMELKTLDYREVAQDWESRNDEWYHALISMDDLRTVLTIPNLKVYAWCRCKLIDQDGSESHHHWHGLVHFSSGKLSSWKVKAWRHNYKFHSKKITFKKIIYLDHAVGVLRYLACSHGQCLKRGSDGLLSVRHTHYARQPISEHHRHKKGSSCIVIRDWISAKVSSHLNLHEKPNWNALNLHDVENCTCDRGNIGKRKKREANEKRRVFYKSKKGIAIKKMYKERVAMKKKLLKQLSAMNIRKKCEKQLFDIQKLVKLL